MTGSKASRQLRASKLNSIDYESLEVDDNEVDGTYDNAEDEGLDEEGEISSQVADDEPSHPRVRRALFFPTNVWWIEVLTLMGRVKTSGALGRRLRRRISPGPWPLRAKARRRGLRRNRGVRHVLRSLQ